MTDDSADASDSAVGVSDTAANASDTTADASDTDDAVDPAAGTEPFDDADVPLDAPRCPYCDGPFPTERLRDLHRGLEHYDALDEPERDAFETAYHSETEDLRSFRLRALVVLVVLYFGFLMTYAVVAI